MQSLRCLWAVLPLTVASSVLAEPRPLRLRDAVSLAVRLNPELAAANARVAEARGQVLSARGLDDPLLAATLAAEHAHREHPPSSSIQEQSLDAARAGISLFQPLPIGGRVGLHLEGSYRQAGFAAEDSSLVPTASEQYTPSVSLSIEQPLLRGIGAEVARADKHRSRMRRGIASAELQQRAISLVGEVVQGYWALAHAEQQLELQEGSALAARDQLERVRANVVVGKLPASATAEIEVALALREDLVLIAAQQRSGQELALGRLCGLAPGTGLAPVERLPEIVSPTERSLGETIALALKAHPAVQAARWNTSAAAVEVQVASDGQLPRLDLMLAGGLTANAATLRAASDQLTGFGAYTASAELSRSWHSRRQRAVRSVWRNAR